ncbi:MAG: amidophosphoribosyltransferase [Coriobacteriales bacterium]|jgi:amidophosphoribosyltransferase|nr:amidophosphoribosyltransferase [Coriobacteriales bacterium]
MTFESSGGEYCGECAGGHVTPPDYPDRPDHPEEACAVIGIYAPGEDAARMAYFGLHALQHRGQESAGIAVADGNSVMMTKDRGLVTQVFSEATLASLEGHIAIGHTRYSTSGGSSSWDAAQPHLSAIGDEIIALAHNGTLVNTNHLRASLIARGISFRSATDSEVAAQLIGDFTRETQHMREGIRKTMELIEGAYAMVLITPQALYAFRDPHGIRPLSVGELPDGGGWVIASETCGLDIVGARFVREVAPGEIIRVNKLGLVAEQALPPRPRALCVFEFVYFARPDSVIDGLSVYESRDAMGRRLSREAPVEADIVMGVPDSGVPSAIGYARASGIPYAEGVVKNRYVGRTFIQPTQSLRQRGIRLKLNPLPTTIAGKRIIVVDDSIVRGNTSRQLVQMLREAGASEVHMRVVSPPIVWPCFFGIDTDTQDQLIAANLSVEEIAASLDVDSLAYLSLDGLLACCQSAHPGFCSACFCGEYPIRIPPSVQAQSFTGKHEPHFWKEERAGMRPLF